MMEHKMSPFLWNQKIFLWNLILFKLNKWHTHTHTQTSLLMGLSLPWHFNRWWSLSALWHKSGKLSLEAVEELMAEQCGIMVWPQTPR